jgi:ATP-dependent helicase/nuclease subunit A
MSSHLTPQQRRAVDHRGSSVVLASGAGCGKTHVLTACYLAHLADGAAVGEIVAITFTERAAREMRSRIRAAVTAELAKHTPGSPPHVCWRKHLRDLETAPIATIHGFAAGIIRGHAAAAGIDPAFEVLDDALSATLRTESLRAALHKLLTEDSPVGGDLRELVVLFGWAATREAIDAFLLDPDPPAWDRWLAKPPTEVAREWTEDHRHELRPEWLKYLFTTAPKIAAAVAALRKVDPPTPEANATLADVLGRLDKLPDGLDELRETAKVAGAGKKVWGEADYPTVRDAFKVLREELPDKLAAFAEKPQKVEEAAVVGQRFIRVAQTAYSAYRDRKRRAAAADFHDLLTLARDVLRDHSAVQARLQKQYRFLLLDELQDTDPVQMELVGLLSGDDLHGGKLFAVGDAKQSIYRFRGADVELFRNLRTAIPEVGRLELSRNFRSQPGVIRFVNLLCRGWFPGEAELEGDRLSVSDGNVEFLWAVEPGARSREPGAEEEQEGAGSTLRAPRSALRAREAEAIAQRIEDMLRDDTPRVADSDGPRRVRPADVALLFRSMTHVAIYEAALRRHGLDYYLVGGRAFFAQQEVYDLLNLLRAVENPLDGFALAGVLRSPFCNLTDEALHLIGTHPEGVWAGLFDDERLAVVPADQRPAVARARRFLTGWRSVKDTLPIAGLLNRAFADSGYDAATQFEFLGDRKLANLWKLVDLARDFDRTGFGLPEFIAHLSDQVARQPREEQAATQPENADVVKLMSVHQAKGLEFPVVIVPDLGAATRGAIHPVARWHRRLGCLARLPADVLEDERESGNVPFSDFPDRLGRVADQLADREEDLRILYVACTRARDLLILSAGLAEPPPAKAAGPWLAALGERFDLRTGECLTAGEDFRVAVRCVEAKSPDNDPQVSE